MTAKCRDKTFKIAGPDFGQEAGSIMLIKMALYGLKSSDAAFRSNLTGVLHGLHSNPKKADPDVWIRQSINPNGTDYYEMVLCYVDNVLVLSHAPMRKIEGIKAIFKSKGDKSEEIEMYLGTSLQMVLTAGATECWSMSSDKYVRAAATNL